MTFRFNRSFVVWCVVAASVCLAACTGASAGAADSALTGLYTNPEGNASVEFMAGGKSHFSLHGVGGQCTFTQQARKALLTCDGDTIEFTIEEDGALTGPPDSFLTRMKKKS